MANLWRRIPSNRLTAFSLVKHAAGEATPVIASSEFFGTHTLAGNDAKQTNTSTSAQVDLGLLVGNNASQPNTSTTGAMSQGLPHARAEQLAVRVISQSDPVAIAEQVALRVISQIDPVAFVEQVVVRVVSSVIEDTGLNLTGNSAQTAPTSTSGAISQTHVITGNSAKTQPTSTSGAISQTHVITGNNAQTAPTSTSGAVVQTHTLAGNNAQTQPISSTGAIAQTHALAGNNAQTQPTSSTGAVVLPHALAGNNAQTTPTSTSGAIAQTHALAGNSAKTTPLSSTGAVSQTHVITGNDAQTTPASTSGAVVQTHALAGNSAKTTPLSSTGAVIQLHRLTGNAALGYHSSSNGAVALPYVLQGNAVKVRHITSRGSISTATDPGAFTSKVHHAIAITNTGATFLTAQTYDITISKGKSFSLQLSYAEDELVYKPITAIPTLAPCRLTVTDHGVPSRWPVRTESALAPLELNMAPESWRLGIRFDTHTIELNDLNLTRAKPFVGPAVLVYQKPADMTGWVLRMQIRDLTTNTLLLSASSDDLDDADGSIEMDVANAAFAVTFSDEITAAITWTKAGYDIEAILPDGSVVGIIGPSKVTAEKEYTVWP